MATRNAFKKFGLVTLVFVISNLNLLESARAETITCKAVFEPALVETAASSPGRFRQAVSSLANSAADTLVLVHIAASLSWKWKNSLKWVAKLVRMSQNNLIGPERVNRMLLENMEIVPREHLRLAVLQMGWGANKEIQARLILKAKEKAKAGESTETAHTVLGWILGTKIADSIFEYMDTLSADRVLEIMKNWPEVNKEALASYQHYFDYASVFASMENGTPQVRAAMVPNTHPNFRRNELRDVLQFQSLRVTYLFRSLHYSLVQKFYPPLNLRDSFFSSQSTVTGNLAILGELINEIITRGSQQDWEDLLRLNANLNIALRHVELRLQVMNLLGGEFPQLRQAMQANSIDALSSLRSNWKPPVMGLQARNYFGESFPRIPIELYPPQTSPH